MKRKGEERTIREVRLKNLLITKKVIEEAVEAQIRKSINQLVLSEALYFPRDKKNYHWILGILKKFLDKNSSRWVNLAFYSRNPGSRFVVPADSTQKIFLFGKRTFILRHIREIAGRIVAGNEWRGKEAGISSIKEFDIKDFL